MGSNPTPMMRTADLDAGVGTGEHTGENHFLRCLCSAVGVEEGGCRKGGPVPRITS